MPPFDIVSRLDFQEIDNSIGNCLREIGQRYDFKDSKTSIERLKNELIVIKDDEMKLRQVNDWIDILTKICERQEYNKIELEQYIKDSFKTGSFNPETK